MCADRGGGLNEMKNLLDRHTQTSVGNQELVFSAMHWAGVCAAVRLRIAWRLESAIRAQFLWSDLLWPGGTRVGFRDGRRN